MSIFEVGDRVVYSGNDEGLFQSVYRIGKTGVVENLEGSSAMADDVAVVFDDESTHGPLNIYTHNLTLVEAAPAPEPEDRESILSRYVEEFDRIVAGGTAVPRYTALGFLSEFLREMEE